MSTITRRPNCFCHICKSPIYRRPSQIEQGLVFCSLLCSAKSQQRPKTCNICQKVYTGAKQTCSRTCANKARAGINYTKENKFNNAYQGSLLKEKLAGLRGGKCERCQHNNYTILQVHHKIERHKGGSDAITNLELVCPNCHASHHLGKSLYNQKKML